MSRSSSFDVLAINESLLQFEEGKPKVDVEVAPQKFERREIQTGLSDGIQIEVVAGLTEKDKVKAQTWTRISNGRDRLVRRSRAHPEIPTSAHASTTPLISRGTSGPSATTVPNPITIRVSALKHPPVAVAVPFGGLPGRQWSPAPLPEPSRSESIGTDAVAVGPWVGRSPKSFRAAPGWPAASGSGTSSRP
jgi:hypothetical protein